MVYRIIGTWIFLFKCEEKDNIMKTTRFTENAFSDSLQ